jgi:hypothetical protein
MRRLRADHDFLQSVNEPRWLVIRNRYSVVIEARELRPNADLRRIMAAERERFRDAGWISTELARNRGFFFCDREDERRCVSIECYEPGARSGQGWPRFRR